MEYVSEFGPAIIEWNTDSVVVDNVIMTHKSTKKRLNVDSELLLDSCDSRCKKDLVDAQYIEICLKYCKKVKVKKIPFFISFAKELKNPKPAVLTIRTLLEEHRNKKLNTMLVGPLQPFLKDKKRKEFYFSGFAYWRLVTIK